jgi:hypothetical protein
MREYRAPTERLLADFGRHFAGEENFDMDGSATRASLQHYLAALTYGAFTPKDAPWSRDTQRITKTATQALAAAS